MSVTFRLPQAVSFLVCVAVIWKAVDLIVSLVAPLFIPYLGFFSYGADMDVYEMPNFIRALTNFDGIFYIRIALRGYQLTEQAYFPLYPILLYNLHTLVGNPIVAGIILSHASFVGGMIVFRKYVATLTNQSVVPWAVLFLLTYPTSYYFGVLYTESLFFLLLVTTLLALNKKWYWLGFAGAYLASLTRVVGVFLLLPIGVAFLKELKPAEIKNVSTFFQAFLRSWPVLLVGLGSLLGLLTYALYLWVTLGDPLYFLHAQESFGANRSSQLITPVQVVYRYLKIFLTADWSFQYLIAIVELTFFLGVMGVLAVEAWTLWCQYVRQRVLNYDRIGLGLFSLANIIVPSLTGTLTAMPRYTLMSLTVFLVLAEISNPRIKVGLLILFSLIHCLFLALFIQGYYVT